MRRSLVALALISAAVIPLAPLPSGATLTGTGTPARSPQDTHCTVEYDVVLSPGFSTTPSSGTYTTGGETGTVTCDGTADGRKVTGPGSWGEDGRYGTTGPNSCTKADGEADQSTSVTLPTAAGPVHLVAPLHLTYGPLREGGVLGGTVDGPRFYGTFTATPVEGDCVTKPVTKVHIKKEGWLVERR